MLLKKSQFETMQIRPALVVGISSTDHDDNRKTNVKKQKFNKKNNSTRVWHFGGFLRAFTGRLQSETY